MPKIQSEPSVQVKRCTNSFFSPDDHWSETLAEAEEHARFHAIPESDHDFEYPGEDIDEDDYERCGCEDPGCPCDGVKWGAYKLP